VLVEMRMRPTKRSTSQDVAKLAHVSRTTVSFILNNVPGVSISASTRKRVLDAAKKLNYSPNSAGKRLVSGKSHTIGFILCQSPEQIFNDAFLPQVILGLEQAVLQQGFHVLLKPVEPSDTGGYTRLITENHVDGILLSGPRQDDQALIRLHEQRVPILLMGQLPGTDIPFVDVKTSAGAEMAVNHLIGLGHKRIGLITNASLNYTSARQRCDGYLEALKKANLPIDQSLIREGDYTPASGYAAMNTLLTLTPRLTAIFVASDVVAMGAILAIKEAGLQIPKDIALVGFDDIPLAEYYDPPLTTIRLPAFGLGWASGERLMRLIQGEGLEREDVFLNSELIVRKSSFGNLLSN